MYRTAIKRNKLSRPARLLQDKLQGRVLDYGCGRGDDARALECEGYDTYYQPHPPVGKFDTILCSYMLNVIEGSDDRRSALRDIDNRLKKEGVAYITVRTGKELKGWTNSGTWQGWIVLGLPVVKKGSGFIIYRMDKGGSDCTMEMKNVRLW